MRELLDKELKDVNVAIIQMGTQIEKAFEDAITALVSQNIELAQAVASGDDVFDRMQQDIEAQCIRIIATQNPLATDLRKIFSVVKIVTDLERLADHCQDIAQFTIRLSGKKYLKPLVDIPKMAKSVKFMIKATVDSYIEMNADKAREVIAHDDIVDDLFMKIYYEIQGLMQIRTEDIEQLTDFLMIAKYLERMADHATNISEWVVYSVDGKRVHKLES
jgi:phosphate transport system protein